MYKLNKKIRNIEYYVNTNNTMFYVFDKKKNKITQYTKDKWAATSLEVIKETSKEHSVMFETLDNVIKSDNDFISTCEIISSTLANSGYFEKKKNGLVSKYFNVFLGGKDFINSKSDNKYKNDKRTIIELLEQETTFTNILIRNLFYNENDIQILNFLNWLNVVGFKDKRQDIIYNFFGTSEEQQGQGAGKGVLITYLNKMFSGLVQSVSNKSYNAKFNSSLQNKKIIVFDEVVYKTLEYEVLKDISGSPILNVEYKGKETIQAENVGSWLMFSNEFDLYNKITIEDRRTFLIRPNPKNGSLTRIVKEELKIDMDSFFNKLYSEINNFIHIISLLPGTVKTPLELPTKTHIDYFKGKSKISVNDLDRLDKILTNKQYKEKVFGILQMIKDLDNNVSSYVDRIIKIIELGIMNYKTFNSLFELLKSFEYINKSQKLNKNWELFKEKILNNSEYEYRHLKLKKTKIYNNYKDAIIVKKSNKNKNISKILKNYYCEKVLNDTNVSPF
jgi:hypothetical protein